MNNVEINDQFVYNEEVPIQSLVGLNELDEIEKGKEAWQKFKKYYVAYYGYRLGDKKRVNTDGITPKLIGRIIRLQRAIAIYGIGEVRRNPEIVKKPLSAERRIDTRGMGILAGWMAQTSFKEKHPYHEFVNLYNHVWKGKIFGGYPIKNDGETSQVFRACRQVLCLGIDEVIRHTEETQHIKVYG